MSDIIHLLPDSVANQIAAGEVIQRPASVVKELVENSIDAGATLIKVIIIGAGRTSIQVIDNGKGMSGTDARMAFERHATSKIKNADDLFALHTMGFRGEALASIAAIANVELRTRREEDELGTLIEIAGSNVDNQELVQAPKGTSFTIKNIFFNVPARRKFLKSDETEMRNIQQEMNRIMLAHPDIAFQVYNGDDLNYDLLSGTMMQRIVSLFGKKSKNISQKLFRIEANTSLVDIVGYVGAPEVAGKNPAQYFFVNDRYMYHPYFRKAVVHAYERMLPSDMVPMFFVSLRVAPSAIDVNIHPTKTEIKFADEKAIWSILTASVKEALGKFNIAPSIDFDIDDSITMPVQTQAIRNSAPPESPRVNFSPSYNPFSYEDSAPKAVLRNWNSVFDVLLDDEKEEDREGDSFPEGCVVEEGPREQAIFEGEETEETSDIFMYKGKYLCMGVKSGLMLIDIRRAMLRVEYDDMRRRVETSAVVSQKVLFPEILEFNAEDLCLFTEIEIDMQQLGFEIRAMGKNIYSVDAIPATLGEGADVLRVIDAMLDSVKDKGGDLRTELNDIVCISLAKSVSIGNINKGMGPEEREVLVGRLFQSANPNYTPEGRRIISTIRDIDIDGMFR